MSTAVTEGLGLTEGLPLPEAVAELDWVAAHEAEELPEALTEALLLPEAAAEAEAQGLLLPEALELSEPLMEAL